MEDDADLELAPQPLEDVAVEDVAHPGGGAAAGRLLVDRPDVERHDLVAPEIGEPVDQAVSDLSARPGHQHHRFARHADPSWGGS